MIHNKTCIVDVEVVLEKFDGKGGWTYAAVPSVAKSLANPFGWIKVEGFIDDYEVKDTHLMPMGGERLFVPVKAAIRKAIKKNVGDSVRIKLFATINKNATAGEFLEALKDEPKAEANFDSFPEKERKAYIDWIFEVESGDVQVERMAAVIDRIAAGKYLPKQKTKKD